MGFDLDTFTESGKIVKMEIDYSDQVNETLAKCEKLVVKGNPAKLSEAIELLLNLEKQTRAGADMHSTSKILVGICKLCYDTKQWDTLNEQIQLLVKRRGQFKQAVTAMVQKCCEFVEKMESKEKLQLITTLRTITAGKIYVEVERARLTYLLAQIKESEGNLEEACKVMQDTQVETLGSMEKQEKTRLILEQIRYCLAVKDFIRAQIISKKISTRFFESEEDTQALKLKYYQLMIEIDQHSSKYLDICRHYQAVFQTKSIKEDAVKRQQTLKNVVLYAILAPYDNEQSDLIHRISQEKHLDEIPDYKKLLKAFTTLELISWNFVVTQYETLLRQGTQACLATDVFQTNIDDGQKRWKDFKSRIVEHNIRIMEKYYSRIRLDRMSQLLNLSSDEAEEVLSYMVVNKTIWAKVDRLEGIVNFSAQKHPNETLNDWSRNLNTLMTLVGKTNHLINKEEMNYLSRVDKAIRVVHD